MSKKNIPHRRDIEKLTSNEIKIIYKTSEQVWCILLAIAQLNRPNNESIISNLSEIAADKMYEIIKIIERN